jgi:hypothetical protein
MKPLSVQLYSLRAEAEKDFTAVLKRLASIGYVGVEPGGSGFWDLTAAEFKKIVTDLGMEVSSSHCTWCNSMDYVNEAIETAGTTSISPIIPKDQGSLVIEYTCHSITINCIDHAKTMAKRASKKILNSRNRRAA